MIRVGSVNLRVIIKIHRLFFKQNMEEKLCMSYKINKKGLKIYNLWAKDIDIRENEGYYMPIRTYAHKV